MASTREVLPIDGEDPDALLKFYRQCRDSLRKMKTDIYMFVDATYKLGPTALLSCLERALRRRGKIGKR